MLFRCSLDYMHPGNEKHFFFLLGLELFLGYNGQEEHRIWGLVNVRMNSSVIRWRRELMRPRFGFLR